VQSSIPESSEADLQMVAQLLLRRHGGPVPVELAESEVSVGEDAAAITLCPTVYRTGRGAHFVVFKTEKMRFRARFFDGDAAPFSTGREGYASLDVEVYRSEIDKRHRTKLTMPVTVLQPADDSCIRRYGEGSRTRRAYHRARQAAGGCRQALGETPRRHLANRTGRRARMFFRHEGVLIRLLRRLLAREPIRRQDYAFIWRAMQLAVTE